MAITIDAQEYEDTEKMFAHLKDNVQTVDPDKFDEFVRSLEPNSVPHSRLSRLAARTTAFAD